MRKYLIPKALRNVAIVVLGSGCTSGTFQPAKSCKDQCGDGGAKDAGAGTEDAGAKDSGAPPLPPPIKGGAYTHYWVLGQSPEQTTVYLYARYGADVTFGGTLSPSTVVKVPSDTFTSYNAADLGYAATGTEWYFLEMSSDRDFMTNLDRVAGSWHGDAIHNKPPQGLSTTYYFPFAQSGPEDDILVLYAPMPTTVMVRRITTSNAVATTTEAISGLYVSNALSVWPEHSGEGFSLVVTADQPIAAVLFDELDPYGSGYYFGNPGQTELYSEYMRIHYSPVSAYAYHSIYLASMNELSFFTEGGELVTTQDYPSEASLLLYHASLGYDISAPPYLIHIIATEPYADGTIATPVESDVRAAAAYMGWNASLGATLEVYASEDTDLTVYDGRNDTLLGMFSVEAGTIFHKTLEEIGFRANEPFLASVQASIPVYQQIWISSYLRQYPGELGPVIE